MKTQKQMWKEINEPKVKGLVIFFDNNGKPIRVDQIWDRLPLGFIPLSDRKPKKRGK